MKHSIVLIAGMAVCASAALAQNVDVIKSRQAIYKSMAAATKTPANMLKGAAPYDQKTVDAALDNYVDAAKKLPTLFPDDSKTGEKTQALPAIWEHKDDFAARLAKFGQDAAAAKASITDEASFKAQFPKVLANCSGCHKVNRAP
jgi:cytochrome c556